MTDSFARLGTDITACRACPRLVEWREEVAREKRAAFRDEDYWGAGVPGFGDPQARIWVLGLAPAAHGANRTGRVFTGDRSGEWLFRALHRAGLADRAASVSRGDGLALEGVWVSTAVRCAPPGNSPAPAEREACAGYLARERALLGGVTVVVALGSFAYAAAAGLLGLRPRPAFAHAAEATAPCGTAVLCSYHPSQQNTFTGRLTEGMLDDVVARAVALAGPRR